MKKKNYETPSVLVCEVELGRLLENVSFNPNEKGEADAKLSIPAFDEEED